MGMEFLPALIGGIERLEERDRIGDVDQDWETQLASRHPEWIKADVIDCDEPTLGVARAQAKELPDPPDSSKLVRLTRL
ncbi:MAG: hypothetical protein NVS9B8_13430 [Candidatus Limnocylindrales bacterium]